MFLNSNFLYPLAISLIALFFLDPWQVFIPNGFLALVLGVLILVFSLYGVFIFKEKISDEREISVRAFTHRVSYLVGLGGLIAIVAFYFFRDGHVYPEVVILLVILSIVKSLAYWYADKNL